MPVKLNSTGGGSVTLTTPSTASDFTLTAPAQTATLITNSSGVLDIGSGQIYKDASGNVGIGTSSPDALLTVNTVASFGAGAAALPSIAAKGDLNTGIWFPAADTIAASTGGSERARITSGGNLLVGTTSDNGSRLRVTGNAYFDNFVYSPGVYNQTTGSAANMHIATDGNFFRSTSSRKYKRDIQDATFGLSDVLALRPVTYKGNSTADGEIVFGGLIAEEVHDAGLTQFVQYAEDGTPDALAYGNMVALCIKAIQELKAENDDLKARLTALEAN